MKRAFFVRQVTIIALCCFGVALQAQEKPKQSLLPLRVTSNILTPDEVSDFTTAVISKLKKYRKFNILPVPKEDPMDLMVDSGCVDLDAECLAKIGEDRGADLVLYTDVSESEGRIQVQVRLVDVKTKEMQAPEGGTEVREKAKDLLALAIEKVLGPEPLPEEVPARVDIVTNPPGCDVYIGQDFVGVSPVTVNLKKGRYVVKAERVGFVEAIQTIDVEPGKTMNVSLSLREAEVPTPTGPVPVKEREGKEEAFYKKWWFWTAVGAVVVASGTTAFVLASKTSSSPNGKVSLVVDPSYAPMDVTLYPIKMPGQ